MQVDCAHSAYVATRNGVEVRACNMKRCSRRIYTAYELQLVRYSCRETVTCTANSEVLHITKAFNTVISCRIFVAR